MASLIRWQNWSITGWFERLYLADQAAQKSILTVDCVPGAILTKMDGDSRGGAALSVRAVSGKPIKFVGAGEKLEALEPFYPDRLTSRILGTAKLMPIWGLC